jgi:hypothetical protein
MRPRYSPGVGVSLEMVVGVVILTLLGVFLTGPGMWSEKWGWSWMRGERRKKSEEPPPPPAPPYPSGDVRASTPAADAASARHERET